MKGSDAGESAIELGWLPPSTSSLVALARTATPQVWLQIRTDPGAILLLARNLPSSSPSIPLEVFRSPAVLELASRSTHLGIDSPSHVYESIRRAAIAGAAFAEVIAKATGLCDPACAWLGALVAPLGWFAVAAAAPDAADEVFGRLSTTFNISSLQHKIWGLDAPAIGRRLARRWRLPCWLHPLIGSLALPANLAVQEAGDERLMRIVQLAYTLTQTNGFPLGMAIGTSSDELLTTLGLAPESLASLGSTWRRELVPLLGPPLDLSADELLRELLASAAAKRQIDDGPTAERLERELDGIHSALVAERTNRDEQLHRQKLRSLAEFAAGAGHEINNPLAVISGQSQYLLAREDDAGKQAALKAIVRSTERIHHLLTELMQFARPPLPQRHPFDLTELAHEVADSLRPQAEAKAVAVQVLASGPPVMASGDRTMIRTAIGCLARNAVEAAPTDGWVRIHVAAGSDQLVIVEDSGSGPAIAQREHLFDPFFSGRQAGRGRGLGLPTAWRFAQENGGDVRYEPTLDCPARFVLSLPRLSIQGGNASRLIA